MDSDRAWELPPLGRDQASAGGWAGPGYGASGHGSAGQHGAGQHGAGHYGQNQAGWAPQDQQAGWAPPGQPGWAPPGQASPQPGWAAPGQVPPGQVPGGYPPGQAGWGAPGQQAWAPPGPGMYQQQAAAYPGQGWPGYAAAPMPMQVAAKNPALHALASAFLPGLGSMLAGNGGIGALILVTYVVGWFLAVVVIGFPILAAAWIWGIVNGHSSAVTWNRNHGIIS